MVKILENTTASPVFIADLGITVPASGQFLIQQSDYENAACSEDIILPIANGTLTVNDGQMTLSVAEGVGLIQGSFIKKDFVSSLKENDRLKIDVEGTLTQTSNPYVYMNQTSAQTGINITEIGVNFDNTALNTDPSIFDTTVPGELTIVEAGAYEFELHITADTENASRRTSKTVLQKFNGLSWDTVASGFGSSAAYGYHRNNASGENTVSSKTILSVMPNDVYRYAIKCLNSGTIRTVPDGTSLLVKKL